MNDRDLIDRWFQADKNTEFENYLILYLELRSRFSTPSDGILYYVIASIMAASPVIAAVANRFDRKWMYVFLAGVALAIWNANQLHKRKVAKLKLAGHEQFRVPFLSEEELHDFLMKLPLESPLQKSVQAELDKRPKYRNDYDGWRYVSLSFKITYWTVIITIALGWIFIVKGTVLESLGFPIREGTKIQVCFGIAAIAGVATRVAAYFWERRHRFR